MSRKYGADKTDWARPVCYALVGGYGPLKSSAATFLGAVVVLDDGSGRSEKEGAAAAALYATAAEALCLSDQNETETSAVVVVDLSLMKRDIDASAAAPEERGGKKMGGKSKKAGEVKARGKSDWNAALEAEAKAPSALGKAVGKPLAKALERLTARASTGFTLVARGPLAGLALKLATSDDKGVSSRVARVCLLAPDLPAAVVNGILKPGAAAKKVRVDAIFADAGARDRRAHMLRTAFADGADVLFGETCGDAVVDAFASGDASVDAASKAFEVFDGMGRSLSVAEVTTDLDKDTKQPETVARPLEVAEVIAAARGFGPKAAAAAAAAAPVVDADDKGEARVAALVVRGSRCILCRSLAKKKGWEGLRLPSAPAVAGEPLVDGARRAIELQLGIDVPDQTGEIDPLPGVPPLELYRASGATTVVFMKALAAPTYPLEEYDMSDEDDEYDWMLYPRAMDRVDAPTAALLRTSAFALKAAADAGLVKSEHGGLFGQELIMSAAAAPPPGSAEAANAACAVLGGFFNDDETELLKNLLASRLSDEPPEPPP